MGERNKIRVLNGISAVSLQSTRYLVDSLKKIGISSSVVVYRKNRLLRNYEDESLDIDTGKKYLYPYYLMKVLFFLIKCLMKYDVFHFHFGHSLLPRNLDLALLKRFRKTVFMEYHGSDIRRKSKCNNELLKEFALEEVDSYKKQQTIAKYVDGIIVHDFELNANLFAFDTPVFIVPLRINLEHFKFNPPTEHKNPLLIVHSPSNGRIKGTEFIVDAIGRLKQKYSLDFQLLTDMSNAEVKAKFYDADIVIDQLIIGEYGMVSIEAMAFGKPVVCFLDPKYFNSNYVMPPVFNVDHHHIYSELEKLIVNFEMRRDLGIKGREFVECFHDSDKIAVQVGSIYLNSKK